MRIYWLKANLKAVLLFRESQEDPSELSGPGELPNEIHLFEDVFKRYL